MRFLLLLALLIPTPSIAADAALMISIIEQMREVLTTRSIHSNDDCPVCKVLELVKKMENQDG